MGDYYKSDKIQEGDKRNSAFQTANAVREAISLASKRPQPITYEHALNYIHDIAPEHYEEISKLLNNKNESDKVKYFKDLSDYEKSQGNDVEPIDLIESEINRLELIIRDAESKAGLRQELGRLKAAKEYFTPRQLSEHKLLSHDYFLAERPYFAKKIYENDSYKDYKLSEREALRLRLLHPDNAETILGVDMIYEQFDLLKERVRFVHMQYKAWDTQAFYITDPRMQKQIGKMQKHLCDGGFCNGKHGKNHTKLYRLPYCSGFLRPTSNKDAPSSKMKTTGHHLPICEVLRMINSGEKKITKENIKGKSISDKIFEESFNANMLGSRWIPMNELDEFYTSVGLNYISDTIRVHAQEVYIPTEEEIYNKKK